MTDVPVACWAPCHRLRTDLVRQSAWCSFHYRSVRGPCANGGCSADGGSWCVVGWHARGPMAVCLAIQWVAGDAEQGMQDVGGACAADVQEISEIVQGFVRQTAPVRWLKNACPCSMAAGVRQRDGACNGVPGAGRGSACGGMEKAPDARGGMAVPSWQGLHGGSPGLPATGVRRRLAGASADCCRDPAVSACT